MVSIPFVKMVGAGNDFIIIEARKNLDYVKFAKAVCARHNGIGADGVLILDKSAIIRLPYAHYQCRRFRGPDVRQRCPLYGRVYRG